MGHGYQRFWLCECSCEKDKIVSVSTYHLTSGRRISCGCIGKEKFRETCKQNRKTNPYILSEKIAKFYDRDSCFIVDRDYVEKIKKYKWYKNSQEYWTCSIYDTEIKRTKNILLHRLIIGAQDGEIVDHIDLDKNNNCLSNLRITDYYGNNRNSPLRKDNKTGFIGVFWREKFHRYEVAIKDMGKTKYVGIYYDLTSAVKARLEAELEYYGENFAPQRHLFKEYGAI